MINSYKIFWAKAFDFKGRSTRSDFWLAYLANILIYILLLIVMTASGEIENPGIFTSIYFLFTFAQIIPNLSITIRRVRDMGKGWQWIFINLIPIVGAIWFIVILCQPSLPIA
tara:strand:- start:686 stop:1024 length:339 start_codon:yes stop_codon:yes gene_type:complete